MSKVPIDSLLALEDLELQSVLLAGNPAYKDKRYQWLKKHLDTYCEELKGVGVNRMVLWEEYKASNPSSHYN